MCIGGPSEAVLGVLDFEGASKRNRPFLEVFTGSR